MWAFVITSGTSSKYGSKQASQPYIARRAKHSVEFFVGSCKGQQGPVTMRVLPDSRVRCACFEETVGWVFVIDEDDH